MWLYLRRKALATQEPLIVAAAGLWATLTCAGIFSITFSSFGAVFAIAILCERNPSINHRQMTKKITSESRDKVLRPEMLGSPSNI
jgi:hypothetical protein